MKYIHTKQYMKITNISLIGFHLYMHSLYTQLLPLVIHCRQAIVDYLQIITIEYSDVHTATQLQSSCMNRIKFSVIDEGTIEIKANVLCI